jgi:poly(A) polymerase
VFVSACDELSRVDFVLRISDLKGTSVKMNLEHHRIRLTNLRDWITREPLFRTLRQTADRLGCACYLTGGLVRDWLLGRPTRDIDLAVSRQALGLAREFAQAAQGTFVLLKKDQATARVVLPDLQFDFAGFRASSLPDDLMDRDFTINSLALPLTPAFGSDPWEPVDPLNGADDLAQGIIRRCGPECFYQDPLRLLRAYRLQAQLGMEIEPETRQGLKTGASELNRSAPERRLYEWLQLLAQPRAAPTLSRMNEDGILDILFPEFLPLKNTPQNSYHHLNVFDHSFLAFQRLEQILTREPPLPSGLTEALGTSPETGALRPYLKWTALVHDLGKPAAAERRDHRWTFHAHDRIGQELFIKLAHRFRLGHQARDTIVRLIGWHLRPFHLLQEETRGRRTPRAVLRLVKETGEDLNPLFLLALADCRAAQGPERPADLEDRLIRLWQEALQLQQEIILPLAGAPPLISGNDLIQMGFTPGPWFKEIIDRIKEEQWSGAITSREGALAWIQRALEKNLVQTRNPKSKIRNKFK